ncbi:hypothetical protein EMIHUDRAFT_316847 [Emiliania huxleyi CCMP1516]|uniref:Sphingosine-1-phosphate lyase n=2 Tax=Emiliania huxleyi TaxID=2903 RepID=A0A0D3INC9_EMIH1|nr:hypothetical protein EMIHUDRAFT_316847 [Emiliania huxleyi CCMP1516]EOD12764.1 hypothetical protein EMIHUDRAFT_316847 [Emiliania huxleyi CCMP1516]|eukprot:XP_005765193.1 hypothetical protein EMIHUDRAFT_316847 [Emiliania huxleyi CCMP1516]
MTSLVATLDDAVRAVVVRRLRRLDQWSVIKLVLGLLGAARAYRRLRQIMRTTGLRRWAFTTAMPLLKQLPPVRKELEEGQAKVRADLEGVLFRDLTAPRLELPAKGTPQAELLQLMEKRHELDRKYWEDGTITGAVYHGEREHMDFVGKVYGQFAFFNPLHASLHPATRQMDAEVVAMVPWPGWLVRRLYDRRDRAMKTYRDWGSATRGVREPNIAGHYFGIEAVDVAHVRSLIDSNTVALVGSAPQFATGTIDPIEARPPNLAPAVARPPSARGIGLHVDCCLGGFVVPFMAAAGSPPPHGFDFTVRGVTTISCDPHKYGFAPKGASVLMFRSKELRHHMYTFATERHLRHADDAGLAARRRGRGDLGGDDALRRGWVREAGYVESTAQIVGATRRIAEAIPTAIPTIGGLELVGRADACVVAFGAKQGSGLNCYSVADCLKEIGGWELATLQNPAAVHLAVTLPTAKNATRFVDELRAAVRSEPEKYKGGSAGLYGMASSLPTSFIEETAKVYLDTMTACPESHK